VSQTRASIAEVGDSSGTSTIASRCRVTAREDGEELICVVVTVLFGVYNSVRLSELFVVTFYKISINPITNPNRVYSRDSIINRNVVTPFTSIVDLLYLVLINAHLHCLDNFELKKMFLLLSVSCSTLL
jgi:hypothetical protein